uniref:Spermatosis associated 2 like n=1 Tax=Marmota marmota marmota TaxID=9994 RepID=A0A8C5Z8A6_MARMA
MMDSRLPTLHVACSGSAGPIWEAARRRLIWSVKEDAEAGGGTGGWGGQHGWGMARTWFPARAGSGSLGSWPDQAPPLQTFSGGYVHVLKGVLSEELLIQSFQKMGYVRRDSHRLMVTALPPACQLVQVALGCFALRLECEILGEVLTQLGTSVLPAEELLRARRASGDVASCVAWLQQRLAQDEEPPPLPPRGTPAAYRAPRDLYRDLQEDEGSEEASLYGEPSPGADSPPVELAYRPPLWEQSAKLWGTGGGAWEPPAEELPRASSPPYGTLEEELEPEPSAFSFLSLRHELSRPGDLAAPEGPVSPGRASPRHVRAEGASAYGPVPEPLSYQAHSCLAPGALPTLCCDTCHQLHAAHCTALSACRPSHSLRALLSEAQRRLWLQRAQVDTLLYDSPGARP